MSDPAFITALRMLSRRELSERQVRDRLARKGYDPDAIDAAVARLVADGSINDERTARALVHAETSLKKRGTRRVKQRLAAAGITPAVASRAIEETFAIIDVDALMEAALQKRLRGRTHVEDEREFQRLYRYLVGQGFEPDRALALLRRLSV